MENSLSEPRSGVEIEITAPSAANSEDEEEEEFIPRAAMEDSNEIDYSSSDQKFENETNSLENGENSHEIDTKEDEELSKDLDEGITLKDDESQGSKSEENVKETDAQNDEKPANLEMVGDRVLIERDGKFELVDVSEIKAEYFEMLGITAPETSAQGSESTDQSSETPSEEKTSAQSHEEKPRFQRAKTTSTESRRRNTRNNERRTTSANHSREQGEDYSYIKSMYRMTDEQIQIKQRREEAIAKRKKEEKERENEEMRRKREDAESAFQAWLAAKLEEAKERRTREAQNQPDPSLQQRKEEDAQSAYHEWLIQKKHQGKVARQYEERRRSVEASQYVIRDRNLCDEAFKSWLRKKRADARAKEKLKGKRKKSKPKLRKKEPLPLNSKNITYLEYYGYRNNVVL